MEVVVTGPRFHCPEQMSGPAVLQMEQPNSPVMFSCIVFCVKRICSFVFYLGILLCIVYLMPEERNVSIAWTVEEISHCLVST